MMAAPAPAAIALCTFCLKETVPRRIRATKPVGGSVPQSEAFAASPQFTSEPVTPVVDVAPANSRGSAEMFLPPALTNASRP